MSKCRADYRRLSLFFFFLLGVLVLIFLFCFIPRSCRHSMYTSVEPYACICVSHFNWPTPFHLPLAALKLRAQPWKSIRYWHIVGHNINLFNGVRVTRVSFTQTREHLLRKALVEWLALCTCKPLRVFSSWTTPRRPGPYHDLSVMNSCYVTFDFGFNCLWARLFLTDEGLASQRFVASYDGSRLLQILQSTEQWEWGPEVVHLEQF